MTNNIHFLLLFARTGSFVTAAASCADIFLAAKRLRNFAQISSHFVEETWFYFNFAVFSFQMRM